MVASEKAVVKKVYVVPEKIDNKIAALKLKSMGVKIDKLTAGAEEIPRLSGRWGRDRQ